MDRSSIDNSHKTNIVTYKKNRLSFCDIALTKTNALKA
jgi:hypothetical protein